ncbi:LacI family DNA-binding transcriptional regulator [Bifidobacterium biavatii]|uniref:Transcriptional regulator n=1 Tax=Bifidobacterium biavatii DSM 23969 TaxID=1437608 RepID=A0A086ZNI7_9BIFI|nr:LacI family DNA-binding transcriptional regulator [Bifidobacterium biavatii]KFI48087.1 transcriptional regulator [Bifidobacterium biavatii DSM 23969]
MVGMRDVAKQAGVSLSTVSLVVNKNGYVSDDMRERVEDAMKTLNYIPNELARNLYRGRTNLVGVIVPTVRHPFFSAMTAAIQGALAKRGLRTMLCSTVDADQSETDCVDMLRRHMMDGLIMAAHTAHEPIYWTSIGRPIVAFDRYLGAGIPSVGSDHDSGGHLVAERLIATGAKHVVSIGGPRSQFIDYGGGMGTTFPTVRLHAALEGLLNEAGIRYDYVEAGEVANLEHQRDVALHVIDEYPDADAFVGSDYITAYVVQEALRQGRRIPDDLQIVAYDGTGMADAAGIRLTCVRQDFDALAEQIVTRLIQACETADGKLDADHVGVIDMGHDETASPHDVAEAMDLVPVSFHQGESTRR